jgi:hypothetical protein
LIFVIKSDGNVFQIQVGSIPESHELSQGRNKEEDPETRVSQSLEQLLVEKNP